MSSGATTLDGVDASAGPWQHEARLLAGLLRTSRVTLLYGDADVPRTVVLRRSVLPLLQRRLGDRRRRLAPSSTTGVPTERRAPRGHGRRRLVERVVLFDEWGGAPIAGLQVAILSSLPMDAVLQVQSERLCGLLEELCDRVSGQFLIILDGFEQLWRRSSSAASVDDFIDQLSEAVNHDGLRVNFLLSIDEGCEPMLEPLRRRIAGFDDATLRLRRRDEAAPARSSEPARVGESAVADSAVAEPTRPVAAAPTPQRVRRKRVKRTPVPPPPPIQVGGVYAFIESRLTETAGAVEPWNEAEIVSLPPVVPPRRRPLPVAAPGPVRPRALEAVASHPPQGEPLPVEPPSPIDQWLDAVIRWCRGIWRRR